MTNPFYTKSGNPQPQSRGLSSQVRNEFAAIEAGFDGVAPKASPAFTGTPTAPTPPTGDASDKLATTQFMMNQALSATLPGQSGANGKVLTSDGAQATWENLPVAGYSTRTSNTVLGVADSKSIIDASGSWTQTFSAAATLGLGWYCHFHNNGRYAITLDADGSETINGATTLIVKAGERYTVYCNGALLVAFKTGQRDITNSSVMTVVNSDNTYDTFFPCIVALDASRFLIVCNQNVSTPQYALKSRVATITGVDSITLGSEYTDTTALGSRGVIGCLINANQALVFFDNKLRTISVSGDVVTFNPTTSFNAPTLAMTPVTGGVAIFATPDSASDKAYKVTASGSSAPTVSAGTTVTSFSGGESIVNLSATKCVCWKTNGVVAVVDFSGATPVTGVTVSPLVGAPVAFRITDTSFGMFSRTDTSPTSTISIFGFTVSGNTITAASPANMILNNFLPIYTNVSRVIVSPSGDMMLICTNQNRSTDVYAIRAKLDTTKMAVKSDWVLKNACPASPYGPGVAMGNSLAGNRHSSVASPFDGRLVFLVPAPDTNAYANLFVVDY